MKRGFTLIELLAVIVILAIILAVAVPTITSLIESSRLSAYKNNEKIMVKAAKTYMAVHEDVMPLNVGDINTISISELQNANYLSEIVNPQDNSNCSGYIIVAKKSPSEFTYSPYLDCGTNYTTYTNYLASGLLIHLDSYDAPVLNNGLWYWRNQVSDSFHAILTNFNAPSNSETSGYSVNKKAYVTDGANDMLIINSPNNQDVELNTGSSFSVTFKSNQVPVSNYTYFPYGQYTDGSFHMGWGGNNTFFIYYGGGYNHVIYPNGLKMIQYEGYNITFVQKTDYSKEIYVNGVLVANPGLSGCTPSWFKFKRLEYNTQVPLNANYYNIRVYNRPLTQNEIQQNYNIDKARYGI